MVCDIEIPLGGQDARVSQQELNRSEVHTLLQPPRGRLVSKDRRPALDALIRDAKRRRFDVLVCWRLDRLGRSLKHLVTLLDELHVLGIALVSLAEGIDATTPAGKLQMHILAAIAEFERARIAERVRAGLARARAQGRRLGRPWALPPPTSLPPDLTVRQAARLWGVSKSTAARRIAEEIVLARSVGQSLSNPV